MPKTPKRSPSERLFDPSHLLTAPSFAQRRLALSLEQSVPEVQRNLREEYAEIVSELLVLAAARRLGTERDRTALVRDWVMVRRLADHVSRVQLAQALPELHGRVLEELEAGAIEGQFTLDDLLARSARYSAAEAAEASDAADGEEGDA